LRSVAAGPIESPLELHDGPKEQAPDVEKQEAPIVRIRCQVGHTKMRGFDFASATGNMLEYQAKLLESFGFQPETCDNQVPSNLSTVIPSWPDSLQNLILKRHALRVVFLKPVLLRHPTVANTLMCSGAPTG
jgi:hypothetical protein